MAQNKHNANISQDQVEEANELLDALPAEIGEYVEAAMRAKGGIIRERKITSGKMLLVAGFMYAVMGYSLRFLACREAFARCSMSDTAWRKRLIQAVPALRVILQRLLTMQDPIARRPEMAIVDASHIITCGAHGKEFVLHVHIGEDNALREIIVKGTETSETLLNFQFEHNEIVLGDRAYGKAKQLKEMIANDIPFLVRMSPNHIALWDVRGQKIDWCALMTGRTDAFAFPARLSKKGPIIRCVCAPIPQEHWAQIQKRSNRRAAKNGTKSPKPMTRIYQRWTFLATTLSPAYGIDDLVALYRLRWRIETYFKTMKQTLDLHRIRRCSDDMAEAILLLNLIAWSLVQQKTRDILEMVNDPYDPRLSFAVCAKAVMQDFRWKLVLYLARTPAFLGIWNDPFTLLLDHRRRRSPIPCS